MIQKWGIFIVSEIAALIMLQTLFFKFTGAPESVYIFTTLGMEPWGRWGSGSAELVAAILISYPPTRAIGALLTAGIMGGAIMSHLTVLGINVQNDGGLLFSLALITLTCALIVLWTKRSDLFKLVSKFTA
jgi:hypothetical protein